MTSVAVTAVPAAQARRMAALLFLAMFVNYYDRTIPAVLMEPIRQEFGLTDTLLGVLNALFTDFLRQAIKVRKKFEILVRC